VSGRVSFDLIAATVAAAVLRFSFVAVISSITISSAP